MTAGSRRAARKSRSVRTLGLGPERTVERPAPGPSRIAHACSPDASRACAIVASRMNANTNATTARRPRLEGRTLVQFLPGVGPGRAALLGRLGIVTLEDLLYHVPREYLDARRTTDIAHLPSAGTVTVVVRVDAVETRRAARRTDLTARVSDASGTLAVRWFGQ